MNAQIGSINLDTSSVIDRTHPPVVAVMEALVDAEDGVELEEGRLMAKGADGKAVAHAKTTSASMTGTIDGTNDDFTATLGPVQPGSIVINNNNTVAQELKDDGHGHLYGSGTGTVNYITGAVAATFTTPPASGKTVTITYKTKLVGVLINDIDTTEDDAAAVLVHGCVMASKLLVGTTAPDADDLAALAALGIWAK